jgi:hypothetical protein
MVDIQLRTRQYIPEDSELQESVKCSINTKMVEWNSHIMNCIWNGCTNNNRNSSEEEKILEDHIKDGRIHTVD